MSATQLAGQQYIGIPDNYLNGAFAPVKEETTAFGLEVTGHIPGELNGLYVRNGGNPPPVPYVGHYHWFLPDGMLNGIDFSDGRANWFRSRWVRTTALTEKLPLASSGGPADVGFYNPSNTSIVAHAGKLLSLCEFGLPYEVNRNLETVGRYDFGGHLKAPMFAHPKIDPVTNDMFFLNGAGEAPYGQLHHVDPEGKYLGACPLDLNGPTLIHDMGMTENYVIAFDFPVVFDAEYMEEEGFPFLWRDDYPTRFGVMQKTGEQRVHWFEVPPVFFIHLVNSFEEGDEIVLDAPAVDRFLERGRSDVLQQGTLPTLRRWRLNMKTGKSTVQTVSDLGFELPRVDDRQLGRAYATGCGVTVEDVDGRTTFSKLVKYNVNTGAVEIHDTGPGSAPAEGLFVPRDEDAPYGEGWILSYVYKPDRDATDLYILNASDFSGEPAAIVHLPARVPLGFHGTFVKR